MSDEGPIGDAPEDGPTGQRSRRRGSSPASGRSRRRSGRKQHGLLFKVITRSIAGLLALFLIGVVALVVLYQRTTIPQPGQDAEKQVAVVYYADGKTEMGRIGPVNRQSVPLSKVPQKVQYAFLSAEDRNFYDNSGVSPTGIVRAAWADVRGSAQQGGSTITQQYVKNYFLTQDKTVSRKVKEIMISIKIDRKYTKQQILADYLNTIYFGRNAYGIQAASQAYFGVDSSQLTVAQGGYLASVINAPAIFDPANGTDSANRARARMTYVFDGMVKKGWLTQAESSALTFPKFAARKPANSRTGSNGFLVAAVEQELSNKLKLSEQDIGRSGLRITTTIDKKDQAAAVQAVKNSVDNTGRSAKDQVNTGLVAMKPDGAVVAMYGGADYQKSQFNSATMAAVPGGSSFKVFALTAAQEKGIALSTRVSGANYLKLPGVKKPLTNSGNESTGFITLRTALTQSINTAFVRLNLQLGTGRTLAAAKQLGIPASDRGMNSPSAIDTLGVADVHPIDMATAYNTLAADGKRADAHFVQKVTSETGSYSYTAPSATPQVVSKKIANNVANAMGGPVSDPNGTAYQTLRDFGRPAGGKTGTTDNFRSAWFTGFTPGQLTTSVGMYAGDGGAKTSLAKAGKTFYGGEVPTQIWKDFMTLALQGQPAPKLPAATDLGGGFTSGGGSNVPPPASTTTQGPTSSSPSSSSSSSSSSTTSTPSSTSSSTAPTTSTPPPTPTSPSTTAPTPSATRTVVPPVLPSAPNTPGAPPNPGASGSSSG
ncbi:transglycosylase domain-containing protein [Dermatophilaceae bacterium Sec6.4]